MNRLLNTLLKPVPFIAIHLKRTFRRLLVILLYATFIGTILLWAIRPQALTLETTQLITLATIIIITALTIVLGMATRDVKAGRLLQRGVPVVRSEPLDERLVELSDRAHSISYGLLGFALALLYNVAGSIGTNYLYICAFVFYLTIPTAVFAWLEPDPIQDELFEGEPVNAR